MISKANIADIPKLNILVNSAYRGESSKKGWTTEADLLGGKRIDENGLLKIINQENSTLLKYTEANDDIMACVLLEKHEDKFYLGMLTVSPELQGKGIGKILLNAAETEAIKTGINAIYMTVISVRTELIAWYERHGFKKTGETKPFPMNDPNFGLPKQFLEFIVLEKTIFS